MSADEDVQYQPRSEEDQIRRSVFSRCLRLLATSTDEMKVKWGEDVKRILDAEAIKKAKTSAKRPRTDTETAADDVVVYADEVSTVEDLGKLQPPPAVAQPPAAVTPEATSSPALTSTEATQIVASYMRQLLDRVVGLSLNVLSTGALSFLCVMLSITSKPPKGKDALYSILANFHYQVCEKIGKRQISNRTVLLHAQQDAAAAVALPGNKKPPPKKATTTEAQAPKVKVERSKKEDRPKSTHDDSDHHEHSDADLEVAEAAATFTKVQRPRGKVVFSTEDPPAVVVALTDATLNKRVMTLVQVLDPVTLDTLYKKVNDNVAATGTTDRNRIEAALKTLAMQGVLFYENGIAYFAG